jgi:hypothetical protein
MASIYRNQIIRAINEYNESRYFFQIPNEGPHFEELEKRINFHIEDEGAIERPYDDWAAMIADEFHDDDLSGFEEALAIHLAQSVLCQ